MRSENGPLTQFSSHIAGLQRRRKWANTLVDRRAWQKEEMVFLHMEPQTRDAEGLF